MTFGSLFAGIGGLDLGLERAGMVCKWQVEIDPFCRQVLARHWPEVKRVEDVRTTGAHELPRVDLICGGFPCQDISNAGRRLGIDGERSGLWSEYARIVRELRPDFVLVENVAALLARGLGRVLGDLAALGYDAEWDCLPAAAVGAPHRRDRIFVVAHAQREQLREQPGGGQPAEWDRFAVADAHRERQLEPQGPLEDQRGWPGDGRPALPDPAGLGRGQGREQLPAGQPNARMVRSKLADAPGARPPRGNAFAGRGAAQQLERHRGSVGRKQWEVEPDVGRVVNGFPGRVDRLRALGNAVVPQVAEFIGRRIQGIP